MVISASLQACGVVFPFAMLTSICRSIVTICSGLYLLIGMTSFSSKWILSYSTWYKNPRSRHVVLGQVQSNNGQIRILAHLIRLPDQTHVWVVRSDRTLEDPLGVESEVARKIAAEFSPRMPQPSDRSVSLPPATP